VGAGAPVMCAALARWLEGVADRVIAELDASFGADRGCMGEVVADHDA
jgi:hypothetical protein